MHYPIKTFSHNNKLYDEKWIKNNLNLRIRAHWFKRLAWIEWKLISFDQCFLHTNKEFNSDDHLFFNLEIASRIILLRRKFIRYSFSLSSKFNTFKNCRTIGLEWKLLKKRRSFEQSRICYLNSSWKGLSACFAVYFLTNSTKLRVPSTVWLRFPSMEEKITKLTLA